MTKVNQVYQENGVQRPLPEICCTLLLGILLRQLGPNSV